MKRLSVLLWILASLKLSAQNPVLLKDVFPGNNTGTIQQIVKTSNYTFFNEDDNDADADVSLFRTDGTSGGTIKLDLTYPGYVSTKADKLTPLGNKVIFAGDNFQGYGEIWSSDGTQAGTVALERFQPANNVVPVVEINTMGSYAYYSVVSRGPVDNLNHAYLRRTNGTAAGTSLIYDFSSFAGVPQVVLLTPVNGILYFIVYDAGGTGSDQLWRSDGTTAGTYMVYNFTTANFVESNIMAVGNTLYLMIGSVVGGVRQNTIWKSDGTAAGTVPVKLIGTGNTNTYPPFAAIGNTLYFAGVDANGKELWKTDGTSGGTVLAADILAGPGSSNPIFLTALNNTLYFNAFTPASGGELWKFDGSAASMVKDINPGSNGSGPAGLTVSGNTIIFSANNGVNGGELWITDGTAANTVMAAEINPGPANSVPNTFTPGNPVYFAANNGTNGFEVYKYDNNGDVLSGPHKFYLNDNSQSGDVFTTGIGNNNNNGSKAYPFATINYALSQVQAGDSIYIDAGTYAEQVTIDKGITIIGAGQNLTSITNPASPLVPPPGPFPEYALIQTTQNIGDVNISNLQAANNPANDGHTILIQSGGSVRNCRLIDGALGVFFRVESATKTAVVENNFIQASVFAVSCQGSGLTASVLNNTLNVTNPGFSVGIWVGNDFGPIVRLTATGNAINNYVYRGVVGNSYNTLISENSILGSGQFAIEQNTSTTAVATCNWYGSSDQFVITSKISGAVNFSPWLINGTDNDPASPGFQPVFGYCVGRQVLYVNDNSLTGDVSTTAVGNNANNGSSSAPLATITAALAKAQPSDIIIVDAGTYTEQVNINKDIVIVGAGMGKTILNGVAGPVTPYSNTSETGIIQTVNGVTDVTIDGMTIDGTNSDEQHGIFIQGGGRVLNCELRYVNDGFYFQYLSAQPRTALGNGNYVHHINYVGFLFAGNGLTATATNNVIDLNGALYGIGGMGGYGGNGNVALFTASNNSIINFNGFGLTIGSLQTAQLHNNSLTRITGNYISNAHTVNINATCNWYGTTDAGVIIPNITGAVIYSPWLSKGADNDAAIGFQPLPDVCDGRQNKLYVNDNSLTGDVFTSTVGNDVNTGVPSAPLLTITAAIAKAQPGDSIFVDAGTYAPPSDITLDKAIAIIGTNYQLSPNDASDKRIVNAVRNAETVISNTTLIIGSNNISIRGIAMDPSAKTGVFMNSLNYSNISLYRNRFKMNSNQSAVIFRAAGTATIAVSSLVSTGFIVDDNRFEKFDATSSNDLVIDRVKNVTVNNNAFVVSGSTLRTHSAIVMGGNGVVDGIQFNNNTVDNALTALASTRVANAVFNNNKIYNTTNALVSNNSIPESANHEFTNNLLDGGGGVLPFIQFTRNGGTNTGSSSSLKIENNTITATAIPTTTTLLGSMNLIFANSVLNPSLIVRGNNINYGGNLSTIEGQLIRPIVIRGNLKNAVIEKNEIMLSGTNLQPKTAGNLLPVCPAITIHPDNGATSFIQPGSVINILNNKISGFKHSFVIFDAVNGADPYIGFGNLPPGVIVNVHENSFTGDSVSINTGSVGAGINATCNWYGSSAVQNIANKVSTDTDNQYLPYLSNGTDNDPAIGFQPVPGSCNGQIVQARLDSYTNVTCNGASNGAINITVYNGVAPFVFTWTKDGDAAFVSHAEDPTGLPPGTYHLTITDALGTNIILDENTDITTIDATITEPAALTADAGGTNVSCNGGSNGTASVTAGGGTEPYSYSWNNGGTTAGINNLIAGLYTVTVTDGNGCTKTASYQVTQPALLTATGGGTNVSCFGGSNGTATVTVGGGTLPYGYSWSNGSTNASITGLTAGLYTVTVTDGNGCTKTASYQVTQPTQLTAVATGTSTACANSATVAVSGGTSPYSYSWSNGATTQSITSLAAGTYTVTVTDGNGCQKTASCTVTANQAFNPSASVVNVSCYGSANGSITITNANGVAPFKYSINGVDFQPGNVFNGLAPGTYTITVKDVNGCTGFITKTVTQPAQLVVTPGTVQNTCSGSSTGSISVIVSGGSPSYSYLWSGPNGYSSTQLSISALAVGNYSLTVTDSKGCSSTLPVTVSAYPAIVVTESITDVLCAGGATGSIDLTVSGGTGNGFTYLWNNGATTQDRFTLTGGNNYKVTITDAGSGCTLQKTYTVGQPLSSVSVTVNNQSIIDVAGCSTLGSFTAQGAGGTQYPNPDPYRYSINGNYQTSSVFTNLQAGAYTVTVKDANGCIATKSVTIADPGSDEYESVPNNPGNNNNNNKGKAAPVSLGTTVSARIGIAADVDYYKLGAASTWVGNYTLNFVQPSIAVVFDLVGSNGTTIIAPTSSSATYKQYNNLNGTYYVRVSGTNSLSCYQFTVNSATLTRSSGTTVQPEMTMPKTAADVFDVKVLGNPSPTGFVLNIISSSYDKASMRVFDAQGRLIEERQGFDPMETLHMGEKYISGVYMVEIRQGRNRKTMRLIKM